MNESVKVVKPRRFKARNERLETSSGNVFADLGFQDAEERLLKARLATKIAQLVKRKGWTKSQIAERTALNQRRVSLLLGGELSGFSIDYLFAALSRLESLC